jgi:uncharacterized protein with GYD domain
MMPLFITRGNYTRAAISGMIKKPEDRTEEVKKLFAAVGGKLHGFYMTFGEYDFCVIAEAPNEQAALAGLIAVAGAGGATNLNTTLAVSAADMKAAFAKAGAIAEKFRSAGA